MPDNAVIVVRIESAQLQAGLVGGFLAALESAFVSASRTIVAQADGVSGSGALVAALEIRSLEQGSLTIRLAPSLRWVGLAVLSGVLGNVADRAVMRLMDQVHRAWIDRSEAAAPATEADPAAQALCRAVHAFGEGASVTFEATLSDGRHAKIALVPTSSLRWAPPEESRERGPAGAKVSDAGTRAKTAARKRQAAAIWAAGVKPPSGE
jgi:hypothetical protein